MSKVTVKDGVAHSEIGASSMRRWANCPGSVRLSRGIPSRSSPYAEEGTQAHEVAAHLLEKNRWPEKIPYSDEMNEAVRVYVDYVEGIIGSDSWAGVVYIEHRFDLSRIYPGLFGTADCVVYDSRRKRLYVIDYKHGQGIPVDVVENEQLLYYGLGALITMPHEVEEVVLVIVQPRCFHNDGLVREWATTPERLFDFAFYVSKKAADTQKDNAPLVSGEHCRFCPAVAICPKLHTEAKEVARREFASHLSYDPVQLSQTLEKLDAVEAWAKGVRAFAYAELEHGREIPGWKLVQKRAMRRWRNAEEAAEAIRQLPESGEAFNPPSLKTVAQVEKALGKEALAGLVVQESSGFALAPESDPRPAAKVDARTEFTEVPMMEEKP